MKRTLLIAAALTSLVLLAACAAGSGESAHAAAAGPLSQLLLGFWHGVIAPVALIIELINHFAPHTLPWRMQLYETRAAGFAYDVGFYVGLAGGPLFGWTRWRGR
jgi:hypothetical protein